MSRKSSPHAFWKWFQDHEEKFFHFNPENEEREKLFDTLARALQKIHRNLTFEFGPPESVRELVVSAGGIKRAFPSSFDVNEGGAAAYALEDHCLSPDDTGYSIQIGDTLVDPAQVEFILLNNGKRAALNYLFQE